MLFVALLFPCPALAPQAPFAEKLNAPLDFAIVQGDVNTLEVSGDGQWILYTAQQEQASIGLYLVKRDGTLGPWRVSPPDSPLRGFALNHLGNRVVFGTDARTLWMADSSGTLTQLNPPLGTDRAIAEFRIAPGGLRALYRADQEVASRMDLYSVPLFGATTVTKLAERVDSFDFSRDGARVIYPRAVGGILHLFSAPVNAGSPAVQLNTGVPAGSSVLRTGPAPATDPAGLRTVFAVDDGGKHRLFSAPTDGSAAATGLSGPIVTGGDVTDFRITPDGQTVVYVADALVNNRFELFSAPIDGSVPPVAISGARVPLGVFAVGSTGEVVFEAELRGRLFRTALDGLSAPVQLTPSGGDGGSVLGVEEIAITPDGAHAVYVISPSNFFAEELRGVRLDGSAPSVFVCPPLSVNEFVRRFELLPDGDVLYLAGGFPVSNALYRARPDGSTQPVALHALASGWNGTTSDFAVAGAEVVFRSDLLEKQVIELFTTTVDGSGTPARRNTDLYWTRGFEGVERIGVSADGRHAAYSTASGIHTLALSAPGSATTVVEQGFDPLLGIDFTGDPARFTYTAITLTGRQLFSAPFDGSAPPQQLSAGNWAYPFGVVSHRTAGPWVQFSTSGYFGPEGSYFTRTDGGSAVSLLSGPHVLSLELNVSGTQFLFRHQADNPFVTTPKQVFLRDPLAASSFEVAPVPGSPPYLPQALAASFSADGARVVFVRDQEAEQHFELFSVLPFAGAAPVKLSGILPAEGDVAAGFALAPDATRVVYAADRDVDGALQLFVSPLDGSAPPLELSPALAPGESVALDATGAPLAWITRDSTRVLFVRQGSARVLLSVPLDGSAPASAVGLAPAPGAGLAPELGALAFTRDGQTVVFRAALTPDRFELFAAPASGGAGVRLATTPGPLQDVEAGFRVLRNSREVLFRGDLGEDERQELWVVPVDASRAPRRVSALGPHDADVEPDFVLPDDEAHVYYRADAEHDGEIEFFRHTLRTPAVRRR